MVWDPLEEDWQAGIAAAKAYREKHGHLRVPQQFVSDGGFRLGAWISARRSDRTGGILSAEHIAPLDALGMVWHGREERWQRAIAAAEAYREANGHLRVPGGFVSEDGFRLGKWISHRRSERTRGRLSSDRIAELDAIGMIWDARNARLPAAT